ncbi:MAG: glutaredoxin family protein [Propionivibrio sp.]|uniref:Glutaredoxin family protein n=1 Tax=Candidatus Propionivibrio dominans TaxID=2954373 RepID=A0A9D7F5V0_9RHOO|nr:glutaredoxin family protein [Candidatus Propionivibrio dominans]MBL0165765.1 glutaredoxin family protein [Propionivibrio sp.]
MNDLAKLTLISRAYCHLCQEMELALLPLMEEFGVDVEVLDVDADPELEALYDELVPVLLHEESELCHYFLDVIKVRDYLSKIR